MVIYWYLHGSLFRLNRGKVTDTVSTYGRSAVAENVPASDIGKETPSSAK